MPIISINDWEIENVTFDNGFHLFEADIFTETTPITQNINVENITLQNECIIKDA